MRKKLWLIAPAVGLAAIVCLLAERQLKGPPQSPDEAIASFRRQAAKDVKRIGDQLHTTLEAVRPGVQ